MSLPSAAFNSLGTPTPAVAAQRTAWALVDTIQQGTTGMRLAGRTYLPQEPREKDPNYENRLARSTFDNFYSEAIGRAVDKVFARDITLKEQPTEVELWWQDVDSQGQDGTQFAKQVFHNAVHHGVTYILTDYPRLPQDQPFKNRAEELAAGRRPYWVNVLAPNVLAADSMKLGGTEKLYCFRFLERVYELDSDGLTLRTIDQLRQFKQTEAFGPVEWTVFRADMSGKSWVVYDTGLLPSSITSIPVVPVYGNRTGFFLGLPALLSLAELNVQHWRKRSDLDNILHIANVPFLFGKGFGQQFDTTTGGKNKAIDVDIQQAVMTANKDADLKWVEHTGQNIKSAMEDLKNLEDRMRDLGSTLFSSGGGFSTSATEKTINAAEANARLKSLALALQDALELALSFVKMWSGMPDDSGTLEVNTSFSVDFVANETFQGVLTLFKMGLITKELVLQEAKRRNIIALEADVSVLPPAAPTLVKDGIPQEGAEPTGTEPKVVTASV